jgi:hypothetical protein
MSQPPSPEFIMAAVILAVNARNLADRIQKLEASVGFEPAVEVLQTAEGGSPGFAEVHAY